MKSTSKPVERPIWLVFIAVVVGMALIAGIIAFVAYHFFYMIIIFTLLIAVAGGIFGWLWADRLGFGSSLWALPVGAVCGLIIYGLYRYFEYLLFMGELDGAISLTFWEYTTFIAEQGFTFSRRPGSSGIELSETIVWIYWAVEIVAVAGLSGWLTRLMDQQYQLMQ
jgi:hypothetical protein